MTEPTEARQDELAGIREKIARFISEFKDWDGARQYVKEGWLYKADQILNLTVSSGGGVCPECKGNCGIRGIRWDEIITKKCPTCNGTGQKPIATKTLEEWAKLGMESVK